MGLYLGIDASTQSMKCIVIDTTAGRIAAESNVNFGRDLPQYDSPSGFLPDKNPLIKRSDPRMWLDALELAFERLAATGVSMSSITGISGSGQQHGSVYLADEIPTFVGGRSLAEQIAPILSRPTSPIWMDRSTEQECRELEAQFGARLQQDTGSPAIERFTGPQIRKFAKEEPEAYAKTKRIHLVSSFLCSVLCGKSAPVDYGDGAGMNLLNLKTLDWDPEIAEFTAPGLLDKLPDPEPSKHVAGTLDPYFKKFGFRSGIPVCVWSGDNPNSLIGIGAALPGFAGISLGTSDTFFSPMPKFATDPEGCGHVFGNPAGGFMSLICFSNGSLAREKVKDLCGVSWQRFDVEACQETRPGNEGRLMLPYFEVENTPLVLSPEVKYNFNAECASDAQRIRAIFESQALTMRLHTSWLGEKFDRIRVTGGASKSLGLRHVLADVFNARIETISVTNSAGLGAAMRAANAIADIDLQSLANQFCATVEAIEPNPENVPIYDAMLNKYAEFERSARSRG